jgi:hypothetical protein
MGRGLAVVARGELILWGGAELQVALWCFHLFEGTALVACDFGGDQDGIGKVVGIEDAVVLEPEVIKADLVRARRSSRSWQRQRTSGLALLQVGWRWWMAPGLRRATNLSRSERWRGLVLRVKCWLVRRSYTQSRWMVFGWLHRSWVTDVRDEV